MDRSSEGKPPSMADIARMKDMLEQNQKIIATTMERELNKLDPEDKEILRQSKEAFLNHASAGFWLGAFSGVAFAMRGRFATANKSGVPKLFYPSANGKSTALPKGRAFGVFKTIGAGVGGSLIGLQVGVFTGSRAGRKVLEQRPGVQERATAAMSAAGDEVKSILEDAASSSSSSNSDSNSSDTSMTGDRDASFYGENEFVNEDSRDSRNREGSLTRWSENTPYPRRSAIEEEGKSSKWEELRKNNSTPPSTWERIRESKEKETIKRRPTSSSNDTELPEPGSDAMFGQDKETRQREFEAMMEKERKGSNSSGFNSDGTWRG